MTDAKALVERLRWLSHNSGWGDDATAKDAADLIEQQAAEIAALRADAERWRYWLKHHGWSGYFDDGASNEDDPARVIAAIDAARSNPPDSSRGLT